VKHGIAGTRDGGTIIVSATLEDELRIVVRNTGAPLGTARAPGPGVGLENVRRRLHHYYGREASLTVALDESGATVAELRLPAADSDDANLELIARSAAG
jgi:LytS/YehU family sensor histidine kinase